MNSDAGGAGADGEVSALSTLFAPTSAELGRRAHGHQLLGLFLIDRNGMIRWHWVEAMERPEDIDTFPTASEVLSAAQGVVASAPGSELAPTEPR